ALGLFTAAFVALRQGRSIVAGMAIGSLVYKPQLGMAIGLVFLFAGEWRIVAGAIASAAAQIAVGLAWAGTAVMRSYVHTITHLTDNIVLVQEKRHLLQSLGSFFELLLPWPRLVLPAYLASALLVLVLAWLVWRSDAPLELRYSMLLLATPLVSPHFYVSDLL